MTQKLDCGHACVRDGIASWAAYFEDPHMLRPTAVEDMMSSGLMLGQRISQTATSTTFSGWTFDRASCTAVPVAITVRYQPPVH